MKRRIVILMTCALAGAMSAAVFAADLQTVKLPAPQTGGGKPLMQALSERQSRRAFSSDELPPQVMSDMLWAACGVNRPGSGLRTAPTAKNMQEIDVYVVKADGAYLYDAGAHALIPVLAGDIRGATGPQPFVAGAPVNLVFVADYAKMGGMDEAARDFFAATDTGYVSQNVYLYCASAGLATVVRAWVDKPALERAMKLPAGRKVVMAQTVGYPAK